MNKLISIILASNRPHNLSQLLTNLQETADDPSCIEVLVKIDDGDEAMQHCKETIPDIYKLQVRFLVSPRGDGYYTLHHGYNALWKMSNPETYFILAISDEVRIVTKGWDTILRKYIGFFPDHLFRLKLSVQKYRNYYHYYDCGPCPENFCIMTRRWMEMTEGFGDCWGPDAWCQNIDFHLGLMYDASAFRSVPMHDIRIGGEEAGLGLSPESAKKRTVRIFQEWWRLTTPPLQQEFRRIATKMFVYISATNLKLDHYSVVEDRKRQCYLLYDHANPLPTLMLHYHISPIYVRWVMFTQLMRYFRQRQGFTHEVLTTYVKPSGESENPLLKYPGRLIRTLTIMLAYLFSFLPDFESHSPQFLHKYKVRFYEHMFLLICFFQEKIYPPEQHLAKRLAVRDRMQPMYFRLLYGNKKGLPIDRNHIIYDSARDGSRLVAEKQKSYAMSR